MADAAVIDAGPLISLQRIGRLDLLPVAFGQVFAPPAVVAEFGGPSPWRMEFAPTHLPPASLVSLRLHAGEMEAFTLAQELGWMLVINERRGRKATLHLGLSFCGTAGVLLRAKSAGVIREVAPLLQAMVRAGVFLDSTVIEDSLAAAGET